MVNYRGLVLSIFVSMIISSIVTYGIVTRFLQSTIQPSSSTGDLNKTVEILSKDIDSTKSSLSLFDATLKDITSQVTALDQKVDNLESENTDLRRQVLSLSSDILTMKTTFETIRAYQILKSHMQDSGSNITEAISSQITDTIDQRSQIPSILGYEKNQIKGVLRDAISTLLKSLIPSSSWTEQSTTRGTWHNNTNVYTTNLKTAFPIKVNVFDVDVTITRVIVIATGDVNIVNNSVSNLRVASVLLN